MNALILLTLMSCSLFRGCFEGTPDIPDANDDDDDDNLPDTGDGDDTQVDTGPPPACDSPEVEENGTEATAQQIEMDDWACGVLDRAADVDIMRFSNEEDGWMRVWARGADFGSNADLQLLLYDSGSDYRAVGLSQPGSTDPLLYVPVPSGLTWYGAISDQYYGYSAEHEWEFTASMAKAPLEWDAVEEDDHADQDSGQIIESGERVYGVVETGTARDWYVIDVPTGSKATIDIQLEAWNYGSPLDAKVRLYNPLGVNVKGSDQGATSADKDPAFDYSTDSGGSYGVVVFSDDDVGSPMYWYVLEVNVEVTETDTGDTGDTAAER